MTTNDHAANLHLLSESGKTVYGSANDVRGREVKDKNGESIGKVADLLVDDQEEKVRFLLVEHGGFLGFGEKKSLIPVEAVTKITEQLVYVDQSRERVAAAPGYTPDLVDDRPHHAGIYGHYGYAPYWAADYVSPAFPPMSFPREGT